MLVLTALLIAGLAAPQDLPPISAASDYSHLNRSVTPPRLVHSTDPEYTPQALASQVEGTVVLQAIVGVNGAVTNASVLSPLPAGLDQKALAAVKHWTFMPGNMDTVDIPVLTTIDVIFRLPYLLKRDPSLPPPPDLRQAAALGDKYEHDRNFNQARRYFRLCAATADPVCEYRLGNLLVTGPDVNPNDFTQGIAWLQLSQSHGNKQAAALLATAAPKLSSIQQDWVVQIKSHLEQRNK